MAARYALQSNLGSLLTLVNLLYLKLQVFTSRFITIFQGVVFGVIIRFMRIRLFYKFKRVFPSMLFLSLSRDATTYGLTFVARTRVGTLLVRESDGLNNFANWLFLLR